MSLIAPYMMFPVSGPAYDTYGLAATPGSSTVTLAGVGTFSFIDNETSVVCLQSGLGAGESVTGMTIGGRTAVRTDEYTGGGTPAEYSIWVPSTNGTFSTTDIVITHSATPFRTIVANFNIGNLSRVAGNNDGAADPLSLNANTTAGDVVVAFGQVNNAGYTEEDAVGTGFSSKVLDINEEGDRYCAFFLQTSAATASPETFEIDFGAFNGEGGALTVFN